MKEIECVSCGAMIRKRDRFCRGCGKATDWIAREVWQEPELWKKVCRNCNRDYRKDDKYCRYCGAPKGDPVYIRDDFACIYGPEPAERTHRCETCGYEWTTRLMIDRERFCPECGNSASIISTNYGRWF